ncbi:MAG: hypothetical protein MUC49_21230 [Raineya sp.]|jgi:hypothetical protein|nr:hypothetical protein [Raineya sp.]
MNLFVQELRENKTFYIAKTTQGDFIFVPFQNIDGNIQTPFFFYKEVCEDGIKGYLLMGIVSKLPSKPFLRKPIIEKARKLDKVSFLPFPKNKTKN